MVEGVLPSEVHGLVNFEDGLHYDGDVLFLKSRRHNYYPVAFLGSPRLAVDLLRVGSVHDVDGQTSFAYALFSSQNQVDVYLVLVNIADGH